MKISVEVLTEDNSFNIYQFDITDKILLDIMIQLANLINVPISNQVWYLDGKVMASTFSNWKKDDEYSMYAKKEYITLFINIKNKLITTPQIPVDMKIKELRNILSIKDNIYFRNIKLLDNKTFKYYNIGDKNKLSINKYCNESI